MKFFISLIACYALFPQVLHASDPIEAYTIKKSDNRLFYYSKEHSAEVIAHDSNGFYVFRSDNLNYLDYYNNDLVLEKESEYLKVDYKLRDRQLEKVLFFQDSLYLFYSENRFNKLRVFVKTIDKHTLEQNGNERVLIEVLYLSGNSPKMHLELSLLHNKLLLALETWVPFQKLIKYDFYVFDKGLTLDWTRTDYHEYNHIAPWDKQFIVDEEGAIHILAQIYNIKGLNHVLTDDPVKNQYMVVSYINDGDDRIANILSIDNHFIRDIRIIATEDQSFVCAGFYSTMYQYGIKGAFFVSNNSPTKNIKPIRKTLFTDQMKNEIPSINKYVKQDELISYEVRGLFYRRNSNIVLCGEQVYNQSYNNANNIIIVSFNEEGDMLWDKSISKTQSGEKYGSYTIVAPVTENGFKILYNVSSKQSLETDADKQDSFHYTSPSYLALVHIDDFGNLTSEKLISRERKEIVPNPKNSYDMRDGGLVMFCDLYKEYCFYKFSFF